jgi:hypothetical protein
MLAVTSTMITRQFIETRMIGSHCIVIGALRRSMSIVSDSVQRATDARRVVLQWHRQLVALRHDLNSDGSH